MINIIKISIRNYILWIEVYLELKVLKIKRHQPKVKLYTNTSSKN